MIDGKPMRCNDPPDFPDYYPSNAHLDEALKAIDAKDPSDD